MIRNIKQALESPPAFKLTCYVCISPGMVQESAGKMAKEGEKQPKQCPWTRKGWYNHSKRQRILRKFKFHSLWQLRYNTNSVSQLQFKLLDKGCTKSGVHFATTGKQQPWIQLVWPNTPTLSSTTANYRLSESIFNSQYQAITVRRHRMVSVLPALRTFPVDIRQLMATRNKALCILKGKSPSLHHPNYSQGNPYGSYPYGMAEIPINI